MKPGGVLIEIAWQYDPDAGAVERKPATAEEALLMLHMGNSGFADLGRSTGSDRYVIPVSGEELGLGDRPGEAPAQTPMAVILGCADARVPLELVFSQSANDLFVVRVAGNVLGGDCVGSIDFAITNLASVRLVAVVGHTGCGAVQACVDAYLDPRRYLGLSANLPLRGIVDAVMPAVRGADAALRGHYGDQIVDKSGFTEALVDSAVVLNAAIAADALQRIFSQNLCDELGVAFGVYDLRSRLVGLPDLQMDWRRGLFPAPAEGSRFIEDVVRSVHVRSLLQG
ncbi:MAG: carbonic anhydrase [Candidatus Nanopelagicales bacterium]